jgi:hypothetical protein
MFWLMLIYFTGVTSDQVVEDPLLPWDNIRLTAASCQDGPTYSRFLPPNADSITPQEECNTCSSIVTNMNRWNWQKHYSSMCVGVPRHLVDLCKHYACKMAIQCPEFISNKCVVDGYERFPCPAKYLCWNCLGKHLKDRWMNELGCLWCVHCDSPINVVFFFFPQACLHNKLLDVSTTNPSNYPVRIRPTNSSAAFYWLCSVIEDRSFEIFLFLEP